MFHWTQEGDEGGESVTPALDFHMEKVKTIAFVSGGGSTAVATFLSLAICVMEEVNTGGGSTVACILYCVPLDSGGR